jgi:hypothetical protein
MADASDVSAEADPRLVAVIAELEAAAGEPAYANPGLGLVASVIVHGCLGQDAGVDPGADPGP